jgi:hypothetical protein
LLIQLAKHRLLPESVLDFVFTNNYTVTNMPPVHLQQILLPHHGIAYTLYWGRISQVPAISTAVLKNALAVEDYNLVTLILDQLHDDVKHHRVDVPTLLETINLQINCLVILASPNVAAKVVSLLKSWLQHLPSSTQRDTSLKRAFGTQLHSSLVASQM